jgi:hypothetical protein
VKSGTTPLPGASVTATNTLTGRKFSTTTDVTGAYALTIPQNGRYVVRVELAAFAAVTQEALLNAASRDQKSDFTLVLASREQQQEQQQTERASGLRQLATSGALNLGLLGAGAGLTDAGSGGVSGAELPTMAGNSDLAAGESVTVSGQNGVTSPLAGVDIDQLRNAIGARQEGGPGGAPGGGGAGGPGGAPGGGGFGGGGFGGGRGGRGMNFRNFKPNQPHGAIFWNGGNSALNAKDYSLRGQPIEQPGYSSNRFGVTLAAEPYIPKLMAQPDSKDFFFFTLFGNRASSPFDEYATVPSLAERAGNFAGATNAQGQPITLYKHGTDQTYANNDISQYITPQAAALLGYLPPPNLPGTTQNYHTLTTAQTNMTTVGTRWVRNLGQSGGTQVPAFLAQFMNTKGLRQNINANFNYTHTATDNVNIFPELGGKQQTTQYSLTLGYSIGAGKLTNNFSIGWNRSDAQTTNYFTGIADVATQSGILGPGGTSINSDALNFGLPNVVFSQFNGFNETQPNFRLNQTFSFSDTSSWIHKKHNVRFGGDLRRVHLDLLGGTNATGSFYFTGYWTEAPGTDPSTANPTTGSDFADFLLGQPQETTIQSPEKKAYMRANVFDAFLQDDWRVMSSVTVNAGLRYEYFSPYSEKYDRLANLDYNAGFTEVAPVQPNAAGPFTGKYPRSLIYPDRTAFGPRLGIAVRPFRETVVRIGYGINYTVGQYANFIQDLAYQPPFANVQTNEATSGAAISLANGFPAPQAIGNYAVNKNYRLPYVQVWNIDIQRTLPGGYMLNVGYNGSKGTRLSIVDAPGRYNNVSVSGVLFDYEDSLAFSNYNALTVRLRKRLHDGIALGATYTYSHSIDNASSIGGNGGTGTVVAQNWQNLLAEESNSSIDIRHQVKGDWLYELPFGPDKSWLSSGNWFSHAISNWSVSGTFDLATGEPLTPSIAAAVSDVARGTAGSLRPNRVAGTSITAGGGTVRQWFNTAAFSPNLGTQLYGTASRNSIPGPDTIGVNMSLAKTLHLGETRSFEVRGTASNAFNIVQYSGVNTQYDSPAVGQVTSTAAMRQLTLMGRFRF